LRECRLLVKLRWETKTWTQEKEWNHDFWSPAAFRCQVPLFPCRSPAAFRCQVPLFPCWSPAAFRCQVPLFPCWALPPQRQGLPHFGSFTLLELVSQ
jgi:hypothetical protein